VYYRSDDDDDAAEFNCDGSRWVFFTALLSIDFCLNGHTCYVFCSSFIQFERNLLQFFLIIKVPNLLHVHVCVTALLVLPSSVHGLFIFAADSIGLFIQIHAVGFKITHE